MMGPPNWSQVNTAHSRDGLSSHGWRKAAETPQHRGQPRATAENGGERREKMGRDTTLTNIKNVSKETIQAITLGDSVRSRSDE